MFFKITHRDSNIMVDADEFDFVAFRTDETDEPNEEILFDGNVAEALQAYYGDQDGDQDGDHDQSDDS